MARHKRIKEDLPIKKGRQSADEMRTGGQDRSDNTQESLIGRCRAKQREREGERACVRLPRAASFFKGEHKK